LPFSFSFSFPHISHSFTIHTPTPTPKSILSSIHNHPFSPTSLHAQRPHHNQQEEEEESFQVLTSVKTDYNDIMIVDTPKSTMLLLDSSRKYDTFFFLFLCFSSSLKFPTLFFVADNVHSILYKDKKWTNSYWVCMLEI